ncbi:hypothetical protein NXS19_003340 [Fusarium pseudograminearum]|nr:hypothetical protein NXS19_003340 [Fusarium pseudograminearum]
MPSPLNTDRGQPWSAPLRKIRHWLVAGTDGSSHQQREIYPLNFWFCVFVLFLTRLGSELLAYPWPNLLVTAVCRHYYQNEDGHHGDPSNEFCDDERVIHHWLSMIRLIQFLAPLAATVALIPMGILLDKGKGRLAFTISIISTVIYWGSIAIFGLVRVFPLWCFYISPVFLLFGGGPWAINALVFATLSRTVRPEQRTTAFSFLQGLGGIPGLVGPLLYTASMGPDLWVPIMLALIIYSLTLLPALHIKNNNNQNGDDSEAGDEEIPDEAQPLLNPGHSSPVKPFISARPAQEGLFKSSTSPSYALPVSLVSILPREPSCIPQFGPGQELDTICSTWMYSSTYTPLCYPYYF